MSFVPPMTGAVAFAAAWIASCAPVHRAAPRAIGVPTPPQLGPDAADPLPSLDVLAAADVPEMRELIRLEDASKVALTAEVDACFRANVGVVGQTRAWFEDAGGPRGEVSVGTGLVPPRGPVCVRRGEPLRLVIDASAVRVVIWRSP